MSTRWLNGMALVLVALSAVLLGLKNPTWKKANPLLNGSYDPTGALYEEINSKFVAKYQEQSQQWSAIEQSHGASTQQAHAVVNGTQADVVTFALPSDIELLVAPGLVAKEWKTRLPNSSQPCSSTIVFVVRKGNPRGIKDWPDLIRPGVGVITPDPVTSGNGKLSLLAAWGSVVERGGSEEEAKNFVAQLYQHVPILGRGARDSSTAFVQGGVGDVYLAWENEALRALEASNGALEIIYPPVSIRAEPSVAWVDANVAKHNSETAAKAYLEFLFTDEAQEIFAKAGFRPILEEILRKHRDRFPEVQLFTISQLAGSWEDAESKFFGDNGVFSQIHPGRAR